MSFIYYRTAQLKYINVAKIIHQLILTFYIHAWNGSRVMFISLPTANLHCTKLTPCNLHDNNKCPCDLRNRGPDFFQNTNLLHYNKVGLFSPKNTRFSSGFPLIPNCNYLYDKSFFLSFLALSSSKSVVSHSFPPFYLQNMAKIECFTTNSPCRTCAPACCRGNKWENTLFSCVLRHKEAERV